MYRKIEKCRICGNDRLESVIHLGEQSLTGVFPRTNGEKITTGPLELGRCLKGSSGNGCGLVQLMHTYDLKEMYGENYGYRSSLNSSMVGHLKDVVERNLLFVALEPSDLVIDIGSNDGTLLKLYGNRGCVKVGIDPLAKKFQKFYEKEIKIIPDFFSASVVKERLGDKKARIITSIAMFYDLEDPINFARQVFDILADNGIWVLEQSYMPLMMKKNAYDTICQEHLEYYGLQQIKYILDQVGFKILDIQLNQVNGGSFKLIVAKERFPKTECKEAIAQLLLEEQNLQLNTLTPFKQFRDTIQAHRNQLRTVIAGIKQQGKKIFGYGASTKGNVILQYCGITSQDIPYIADVNEDKFGSFTPNTEIPIIPEDEAKAMNPDYFLVLPWAFRDNFLKREHQFLESGGKFLFPLPKIEIVGANGVE